jgi:phospholipid/cholesterol/gamma-HCH transport system substrate-binding protein
VVGSQDTGELKKSVGSVRSSMDKLDASLANVREITEKINRGEGTVGRLVNDDKLARNLEKASSSLNDLFGTVSQLKIELQERSEFLIGCTGVIGCDNRQPSSAGVPALANYSYNPWTKNYFSVRIIPKPDKWYGIELIDDPRGLVRRVQVENRFPDGTITNNFYPPKYTQITTERQLKFSAYLAKRYGPISGRFGILENTGGFGVKLHLLNDQLILSADAFEFANPLKDHPRVKLYADYRFLDHVLITVGADDLVNTRVLDDVDRTRIISGRDFFVGAGFFFTDEDIKTLIGLLPLRF